MIKCDVKNMTKKDDLYQTYYLKFDNDISCYYYETINSSYVSEVDIVMEGYRMKDVDNNKIYLFFRKSDDINCLKYILDFFNNEYDYLKFNYVGFDEKYFDDINAISKGLNLDYNIKNDDKYVERKNNASNNNYVDYDINDNVLIKKEDDTIDKELIKESANYNGYNENFIDRNVRNIVRHNFKNN